MVQIYAVLLRSVTASFLVTMGFHLTCLAHLPNPTSWHWVFDPDPWLASSLSNAGGLDHTDPDCVWLFGVRWGIFDQLRPA